MVLVKNVNGTADSPLPNGYNSFLDYYKAKKGYSKDAKIPCAVHHNHYATVGAHVIKANSTDKHYYIVPVCYAVNNSDSAYSVDESCLVRLY